MRTFAIGWRYFKDQVAESACADHGRVKAVGTIRRGHDQHVASVFKAIELADHASLNFVVDLVNSLAPHRPDGIHLVDKDDHRNVRVFQGRLTSSGKEAAVGRFAGTKPH